MSEQEKGKLRKRAQHFAESLRKGEVDQENESPGERGFSIGILNSRIVRVVLFIAVSLGLFATGAACILAVWDVVSSRTAWRAIGTLFIGTATLGLLILVNEAFGRRDRL